MIHQVSTCTCAVVTMAKIQFLTILLIITCFLDGVVSVTEFEVRAVFMKILFRKIIEVICVRKSSSFKIKFHGSTCQDLSASVAQQSRLLDDQLVINQQLRNKIDMQEVVINYLLDQVQHLTGNAMAIGKESELTEGKIALPLYLRFRI